MKTFLLPSLAVLALLSASVDAAAHSYDRDDRYHSPPRHGHYKNKHHRHYAPARYAPVVVVPAPRYYGGYERRSYRPDYRHHHHARCGHGYHDSRPYGIAFGATPYDSWLTIRVGN
jgi:hypothetical protein